MTERAANIRQAAGGFSLSSVCADELSAHVYRHQTAHWLGPHWPTRALALRSCGEAGARIRCACCSAIRLAPFRCGARTCPTCAHIASAVAVDRLSTRVSDTNAENVLNTRWEGPAWPQEKRWWLFTGTQQTEGRKGDEARYEHGQLTAAIRRVRDAWSPFWQSMTWGARVYERSPRTGRLGTRSRRDVMYAMGVEVAPGGMTHGHAAVYGEKPQREILRKRWAAALGRPGFVTLKPMQIETPDDFKSGLREVLKYVSKGDKGMRRAEHAAAIERAMRRVRRVEMGGAIRTTNIFGTARDLVTHRQVCTECNANNGQWQWAGLREPAYVVANDGFGLDVQDQEKRERAYWLDVDRNAERGRPRFLREVADVRELLQDAVVSTAHDAHA